MKRPLTRFPVLPGLLLLLLLIVSASARAAVIVNYAMTADGAALNSALAVTPTTTITNVSATGLVNQSGAATTGSFAYNGNTDRVSSWPVAVAATGTAFADAVTDGNYFTFQITPDAGYEIDLSSISFQVASGSSSTTSNRGFFLVSEALPADFTSTSTVLLTDRTAFGGGTIPVQAATASNTIPKDYLVDLTSLAAFTGTRYFRFYIQAPGVAQALTFDDIVVNGTVTSVPEPSASLIGGLGVLCLLRRRRNP